MSRENGYVADMKKMYASALTYAQVPDAIKVVGCGVPADLLDSLVKEYCVRVGPVGVKASGSDKFVTPVTEEEWLKGVADQCETVALAHDSTRVRLPGNRITTQAAMLGNVKASDILPKKSDRHIAALLSILQNSALGAGDSMMCSYCPVSDRINIIIAANLGPVVHFGLDAAERLIGGAIGHLGKVFDLALKSRGKVPEEALRLASKQSILPPLSLLWDVTPSERDAVLDAELQAVGKAFAQPERWSTICNA